VVWLRALIKLQGDLYISPSSVEEPRAGEERRAIRPGRALLGKDLRRQLLVWRRHRHSHGISIRDQLGAIFQAALILDESFVMPDTSHQTLEITKSMIVGTMSRDFYLKEHDPQRWPVRTSSEL
jgi:hypothetical protein